MPAVRKRTFKIYTKKYKSRCHLYENMFQLAESIRKHVHQEVSRTKTCGASQACSKTHYVRKRIIMMPSVRKRTNIVQNQGSRCPRYSGDPLTWRSRRLNFVMGPPTGRCRCLNYIRGPAVPLPEKPWRSSNPAVLQRTTRVPQLLVLRGPRVIRTHDVPKKPYIPLLLHTILGPDYYDKVRE